MARQLTDAEVLEQIAAARARAAGAAADEARAASARYDTGTGRVLVELTNGMLIGFPPQLAPGLAGASTGQLSGVEVSPSGLGLIWRHLDVDISVPALVSSVLDRSTAMQQLGRLGGATRSQNKAEAARRNGRKGGRPRKNLIATAPQAPAGEGTWRRSVATRRPEAKGGKAAA